MFVILSVLIVAAAAGCLAKSTNYSAVDWLPVLFFSIITELFLFYCMDLLLLGLLTAYGMLAAVSVASLWMEKRRDGAIHFSLRDFFTPAMCIFLLMTGILYLYTFRNHSIFWDELRLWAAVPRALWNTRQLQLGENAVIFPFMQFYPPAMPLFVYFLSAFAPRYHEYYAFLSYGIFAAVILVPGMRELKFRQKLLIVVMTMLIIAVPSFFSSHGGDGAFYYSSLFIDTALGMLAGYCFYLSAAKPFDNAFTTLRFCTALAVLTLLKDSGTGFAFCAAANAVLLAFIDGKEYARRLKIVGSVCSAASVAAVYLIWQSLIASFGIKNTHIFSMRIPSHNVIMALLGAIYRETIWLIAFPMRGSFVRISIPFIACIGLIVFGAVVLSRRYRDISHKAAVSTALFIAGYSFAFIVGMCSIYNEELLCFQRYTSTLTTCAGTYLLLRWIPLTISQEPAPADARRWGMVCIMAVLIFANYRNGEQSRYLSLIAEADYHMSQIETAAGGDNENLYLFFAGEEIENARLHHMIYFRTLDTRFTVRNLHVDTHFRDIEDASENVDVAAAAAKQWLQRLVDEGISYIYVVTSDECSEKAMALINAGDEFRAETLYRLDADGTIHKVS